jgi:hypothetical protein
MSLIPTSEVNMLKKTIIALVAALSLFASFGSGANAQSVCTSEWGDAFPRPRC